MAAVQTIKTKIISILGGVGAAFIAFIFGISFVMALAFLTPVVALFYSAVTLGMRFAGCTGILSVRLWSILNKLKIIYKKLVSGISSLTYAAIERKSLIE